MYQAAYIFLFLCLCINNGLSQQPYLGKLIGRLSELEHLVKGDVYAVDSRTIHIKGFNYDGTAPDAYFYVGKTGKSPDNKGIIIPNEKGSKQPLGPYRNKDVTLTLPDKLTLNDIAWISIWCKAYTIDFGHLLLPRRFKYPKPQKVDALPTFDHGVSSDKIVVVDAQTFLIPNFKYDGTAPDAFFWVGKGTRPDTQGIQVADENGSLKPLKRYSGKTIVITLTDDLTVFDIDYLSIWCRAFTVNFGHVILPKNLNVPPSLKMLGVAPQKSSGYPYNTPSSTFREQTPRRFQSHPKPYSETFQKKKPISYKPNTHFKQPIRQNQLLRRTNQNHQFSYSESSESSESIENSSPNVFIPMHFGNSRINRPQNNYQFSRRFDSSSNNQNPFSQISNVQTHSPSHYHSGQNRHFNNNAQFLSSAFTNAQPRFAQSNINYSNRHFSQANNDRLASTGGQLRQFGLNAAQNRRHLR